MGFNAGNPAFNSEKLQSPVSCSYMASSAQYHTAYRDTIPHLFVQIPQDNATLLLVSGVNIHHRSDAGGTVSACLHKIAPTNHIAMGNPSSLWVSAANLTRFVFSSGSYSR